MTKWDRSKKFLFFPYLSILPTLFISLSFTFANCCYLKVLIIGDTKRHGKWMIIEWALNKNGSLQKVT
jgi:hypothetical protein